ncbi:unnamed protein product, partial [marine sediment metagenome]
MENEFSAIVQKQNEVSEIQTFERLEWPFLLIFIAENTNSVQLKEKFRKFLAEYLLENYGLEPALAQYRELLLGEKYSDVNEKYQLRVGEYFERIGAVSDAEELYEKIVQNSDSNDLATAATKKLAQIKLANSQKAQTLSIPEVQKKNSTMSKVLSLLKKGDYVRSLRLALKAAGNTEKSGKMDKTFLNFQKKLKEADESKSSLISCMHKCEKPDLKEDLERYSIELCKAVSSLNLLEMANISPEAEAAQLFSRIKCLYV